MENSPYSIYCHNPRNPYYRDTSEMLKAMFVEIVDFCEAFSGDYFFASNSVDILKKFIDRELPFSLIEPLLPAKTLAKSDEMSTILARIWKPGKR